MNENDLKFEIDQEINSDTPLSLRFFSGDLSNLFELDLDGLICRVMGKIQLKSNNTSSSINFETSLFSAKDISANSCDDPEILDSFPEYIHVIRAVEIKACNFDPKDPVDSMQLFVIQAHYVDRSNKFDIKTSTVCLLKSTVHFKDYEEIKAHPNYIVENITVDKIVLFSSKVTLPAANKYRIQVHVDLPEQIKPETTSWQDIKAKIKKRKISIEIFIFILVFLFVLIVRSRMGVPKGESLLDNLTITILCLSALVIFSFRGLAKQVISWFFMPKECFDRTFFVNGWNAWSFCGCVIQGNPIPLYDMPNVFVRAFHYGGVGTAHPINLGYGEVHEPPFSRPKIGFFSFFIRYIRYLFGQIRFLTHEQLNKRDYIASDMFTILADNRSKQGVVLGFLSQKQQFGCIAVNQQYTRLSVHLSCDGVIVPFSGKITSDWLVIYNLSNLFNPFRTYMSMSSLENEVHRVSISSTALKSEVPVGWCSWYHFYEHISEKDLLGNLECMKKLHKFRGLGAERQGFRLFQVDDGYQQTWGDWTRVRGDRFPTKSMYNVVRRIKEADMLGGLWLAPFSCDKGSVVAKEHPEWVLRKNNSSIPCNSANCGKFFYGLDVTNPAFRAYLQETLEVAVSVWGFSYLKLDFLYSAVLADAQETYFDRTLTKAQIMQLAMSTIHAALSYNPLTSAVEPEAKQGSFSTPVNINMSSEATFPLSSSPGPGLHSRRKSNESNQEVDEEKQSLLPNSSGIADVDSGDEFGGKGAAKKGGRLFKFLDYRKQQAAKTEDETEVSRMERLASFYRYNSESTQESTGSVSGANTHKVFLLGCGAPLGGVLGHVHANRVSADAGLSWEPDFPLPPGDQWNLPCARNMVRNSLTRLFMHGHWWINDPDCLTIRDSLKFTLDEIHGIATAKALSGGSLIISDDLEQVSDARLRIVQQLLPPTNCAAVAVDLLERQMPEIFRLEMYSKVFKQRVGSVDYLTSESMDSFDSEINRGSEVSHVESSDYFLETVDDSPSKDSLTDPPHEPRAHPPLTRLMSPIYINVEDEENNSKTEIADYLQMKQGPFLKKISANRHTRQKSYIFTAGSDLSRLKREKNQIADFMRKENKIAEMDLLAQWIVFAVCNWTNKKKNHFLSLKDIFGEESLEKEVAKRAVHDNLLQLRKKMKRKQKFKMKYQTHHQYPEANPALMTPRHYSTEAGPLSRGGGKYILHLLNFWESSYSYKVVVLDKDHESEVDFVDIPVHSARLFSANLSTLPLRPKYLGSNMHFSCGAEISQCCMMPPPRDALARLSKLFKSIEDSLYQYEPRTRSGRAIKKLHPIIHSMFIQFEEGVLHDADWMGSIWAFLPVNFSRSFWLRDVVGKIDISGSCCVRDAIPDSSNIYSNHYSKTRNHPVVGSYYGLAEEEDKDYLEMEQYFRGNKATVVSHIVEPECSTEGTVHRVRVAKPNPVENRKKPNKPGSSRNSSGSNSIGSKKSTLRDSSPLVHTGGAKIGSPDPTQDTTTRPSSAKSLRTRRLKRRERVNRSGQNSPNVDDDDDNDDDGLGVEEVKPVEDPNVTPLLNDYLILSWIYDIQEDPEHATATAAAAALQAGMRGEGGLEEEDLAMDKILMGPELCESFYAGPQGFPTDRWVKKT